MLIHPNLLKQKQYYGNLLLKMAIGADRTGKPLLRCSLLLHSLLTPLPGQWDHRQSCKYTLGATFVIISQNVLIARHKSFWRATIARHNIKHVLWCAIATRVAFYSRPGLLKTQRSGNKTLYHFSIIFILKGI